MFRRFLIPALLALLLVAAPAATADEPLPKGAEGSFQLKGTGGYTLVGIVGSTGTEGVLTLIVGKHGASAFYVARGEVTREHVHFDLGDLGEIDVAVQPTGRSETIGSECGKPQTIPGEEYVGTIAFHGEEGFTDAEATRTPLRLGPIFNLVCGEFVSSGTVSGRGLPGVELKVLGKDGSRLRLDQNRPGARVSYEAKLAETEGDVRVHRTVAGLLPAGALSYAPSLESASFSPGAPFAGRATYSGKTPTHEAHPGHGSWRGSLKVDFPGHAAVRLAGPTFSASIVPAKHTDFHR